MKNSKNFINQVAATANKTPEVLEKDIRELMAASVCAQVGLGIAGECARNMVYLFTKHRIKNTQALKAELNRTIGFCNSMGLALANFGMKPKGDIREAERAVANVTALSSAAFMELYFAASAMHPDDVDEFCEQVGELASVFIKKRVGG